MKKKISAEVIADSINESGERITSFILTFPRFILAELNTHRALSRNSASSRAIPFKKMVEQCIQDPFIPIAWQKDHKGMQGTEYYNESTSEFIKTDWLQSRNFAIESAKAMNSKGVTKQICNRILEPYLWHTAIVTATDLENFFALRCPQYVNDSDNKYYRSKKDLIKSEPQLQWCDFDNWTNIDWLEINKGEGEIHIMELAEQIYDAYNDSEPRFLEAGEWHIPFGDKFDEVRLLMELDRTYGQDPAHYEEDEVKRDIEQMKIKIATARCARVSYLNFHGKDDYVADIRLYDRLSSSGHWSPFEHCAKAVSFSERDNNLVVQDGVVVPGISGNFRGYIQLRKTFANENVI